MIVYLDSQDYLRMYQDDLSDELAEVRRRLLEHKNKNLVRFPFSFLVLFELLQDYDVTH